MKADSPSTPGVACRARTASSADELLMLASLRIFMVQSAPLIALRCGARAGVERAVGVGGDHRPGRRLTGRFDLLCDPCPLGARARVGEPLGVAPGLLTPGRDELEGGEVVVDPI